MKKVITYGTFDLFHYGHLELLKRARDLGDELIVAVSTDEFNLLEKNKICVHSYEIRKKNVEAIKFVNTVISETSWEQKKEDILNNNINVFTIGDDWQGKFDFLQKYCEVVYLPRTDGISSTLLRSNLSVEGV
jgi:glycerol-3-phosphate cytidylyltransferase